MTSNKTTSARTIAAMIATGFASLRKDGQLGKGTRNPDYARLKGIIGARALDYHSERITPSGLTKEGFAHFAARLDGKAARNSWVTRAKDVQRELEALEA